MFREQLTKFGGYRACTSGKIIIAFPSWLKLAGKGRVKEKKGAPNGVEAAIER
ncbi:MAG: hypothetical protein Fur0025_19210 [Oscillatoriaceae cyanobacterium]